MFLTLNLKLLRNRESFNGDRGEEGLELAAKDSLGLFVADLGVGVCSVVGISASVVRQRRLGLEVGRGVDGLLPPERKASFTQLLGLGLGLSVYPVRCLSRSGAAASLFLGAVVQNARRQPVPIWCILNLGLLFSLVFKMEKG